MKKITSIEPISFRVDGSTLLEITSKGCLATDEAAAIAKERLGEHITVVDTDIKTAVKEAKASLEDSGPTHAELKAKAKELGISISGSKADLEARINETEPVGTE